MRSSYKKTAQLMTSDSNNIDNCKMHTKQCLNELNAIEILMKNMKNDIYKKPVWQSTCINVNTAMLSNDMQRCGCLTYVWDRNKHGEKGIQPVKYEFVTKKENILITPWRGRIQKRL